MFRLVNDSHNKNVQEILESAFNISEILSGADEGYALTFDENTIEEVITFGFDLAEDKLLERRFRVEHLLESVTSLKVQLYLSILILRLNEFNRDNNGRQRFNYILNELNEEEKHDIMFAIKNNYQKIQMNHKLELFNSLYKADQVMFKQMLNLLEQDDLVKYTMQTLMLPKLRKRW